MKVQSSGALPNMYAERVKSNEAKSSYSSLAPLQKDVFQRSDQPSFGHRRNIWNPEVAGKVYTQAADAVGKFVERLGLNGNGGTVKLMKSGDDYRVAIFASSDEVPDARGVKETVANITDAVKGKISALNKIAQKQDGEAASKITLSESVHVNFVDEKISPLDGRLKKSISEQTDARAEASLENWKRKAVQNEAARQSAKQPISEFTTKPELVAPLQTKTGTDIPQETKVPVTKEISL